VRNMYFELFFDSNKISQRIGSRAGAVTKSLGCGSRMGK
jgi:hypothetical protein